MATPTDRGYTKEHEWALVAGDVATIGITDHAQDALGDIVFLELPEVGRVLARDEPLGVVESVKAVSDIYAPLGGEVIEVNQAAMAGPEIVNTDPYTAGWLLRLRLSDPTEVDQLLSAAAYEAVTEGE
ncbi:MAG: glycine cleavage system protein GcvH [Chloroflexi bacterium]|nr:glycine cleavage system protein GcvH [Chloroflexota bacterium]